ncbi:MAG: ArsR family transcriptional regulator [Calditrichaeota bacterium]|nr:MAG: ArsR family transcriptional regulator [Calditrichota bacterium]
MRQLSKLFQALSDRTRLRILCMLRLRPLCVCEIREVLQLAVSTVSKHLSILRDAGLIEDFKDGKWVNYQRNHDPQAEQIHTMLQWIDQWMADDAQAQKDEKAAAQADRNQICSQ